MDDNLRKVMLKIRNAIAEHAALSIDNQRTDEFRTCEVFITVGLRLAESIVIDAIMEKRKYEC